MPISLIVPAPFDAISGGYGYDRRIVAGLRALGHAVDVVELPGEYPLCDAVAREAAGAAWGRLTADTTPVIDGLALPAFHGLEVGLATGGAVGLIHHPVSLETGLDAADQATLERIERDLFPCLTRLIVTSDTTAATLVTRFGTSPERSHVVVPGTDTAPRSRGSGGACEILSIGTLIPRKGHDVLLRALAVLTDLEWHLTIVGSPDRDPPHARALHNLAAAAGIAHRVRFAGELVGDALDVAWHGADVFALATRYEGYGMAIAEALKRGLPVVVADGGAAGALVAPDAGYVCPVADSAVIAESLRRLIADPAGRRVMSERAWQTGQILPSWDAQSVLFAQAMG